MWRVAAAMLVALLAVACTREPEPQAFGIAVPEPARGVAFAAGARCSVELVTGTANATGWRTDTVKPLRFSGWALEDVAYPASEWIVMELAASGERARFFAVTTTRGPRGDLVPTLGDGPGVRNAGFELVARADALPRGRYAIRLLMRGAAGGLVCDTRRVVELI